MLCLDHLLAGLHHLWQPCTVRMDFYQSQETNSLNPVLSYSCNVLRWLPTSTTKATPKWQFTSFTGTPEAPCGAKAKWHHCTGCLLIYLNCHGSHSVWGHHNFLNNHKVYSFVCLSSQLPVKVNVIKAVMECLQLNWCSGNNTDRSNQKAWHSRNCDCSLYLCLFACLRLLCLGFTVPHSATAWSRVFQQRDTFSSLCMQCLSC